MAAAFRGTHTGSAAQITSADALNLPSIFDILSQESLNSSLKPGLKNLIQFLSLWQPKLLKGVYHFYDEFYALFKFALENHYFKRYSASFSENFYGMKRVLISNSKADSPFSTFRGRLRSLLCVVLLPYLANKIELFVKRLELLPRQQTALTRFILRIYPYLRSLLMASTLVFQILYALRYLNTNFALPTSSPLLYFAGFFLQRLTPDDIHKFASVPLHLRNQGVVARLWRLLFSLMSLLGRLFSYGIFFLQFFEYFYANDFTKQMASLAETGEFGRQTAPIHPRKVVSENYVLTALDPGRCPLCFKTRVDDTVVSVSGYVFCYKCIYEYLQYESRCPVTLLPATINELIKIYK